MGEWECLISIENDGQYYYSINLGEINIVSHVIIAMDTSFVNYSLNGPPPIREASQVCGVAVQFDNSFKCFFIMWGRLLSNFFLFFTVPQRRNEIEQKTEPPPLWNRSLFLWCGKPFLHYCSDFCLKRAKEISIEKRTVVRVWRIPISNIVWINGKYSDGGRTYAPKPLLTLSRQLIVK